MLVKYLQGLRLVWSCGLDQGVYGINRYIDSRFNSAGNTSEGYLYDKLDQSTWEVQRTQF